MPHPSVVLATAGYDHTIKFWEATSGRCYRTLQYTDSVNSLLSIMLCDISSISFSFLFSVRKRNGAVFSCAYCLVGFIEVYVEVRVKSLVVL